ncbi:DMT family transporter [Legionella anisa]|uniref:EamA family transporter n=1 Tax=Legionella anisa TaxID=28082 RepID=A0AAX0WPG9_9GAMM|nr:DMT family transporter [Legionella anisa]AWN73179.1 EamA family transporter [Legionella anisa]KTC69451.1 transport protein [Legionella anisa]MBN5934754.1 DMT family transporter [Legionella anisa]MCW8424011.1 DMT family transporter [Legionella anisa]MCW8447533.1 DMT family transporter [Legionella anisa]
MWFTFAIFAAILWGFNYALAEKILNSISPITLLALEMTIGAILFTGISFFTTMKKDVEVLSTDSGLLLLTIAEIAIVLIASYFIAASITLKNATIAGIVELTYPIFTIIFTWFLFNQAHVNFSVIIGGLLIFIGVLVISLA